MATIKELDAAIKFNEEFLEYAKACENPTWDEREEEASKIALEALQDARRRAEGCEVCRMETGIGGHMRLRKNTDGTYYIESESPDSYYSDSESDEIPCCPNCGRALRGEKEE